MKRYIILIVLIIRPLTADCQLRLKIDSLLVYDIVETEAIDAIDEGFGEGPDVNGYFTVYNYLDKPFIIKQMDYSMYFCYNYGEISYESMPLVIIMNGPDSLTIMPTDSVRFECGTYLMVDVSLRKSEKYSTQSHRVIDHTEVFKHILPTLYAEIIFGDDEILNTSRYTWKLEEVDTEYGKAIKAIPIADPMP